MRRHGKAGWAKWSGISSLMLAAVLALCGAWTGTAYGEESGPEIKVSGEVQHDLAISLRGDGVTANVVSYALSLSAEFGGTGRAASGDVYISIKGEYDLQSESGKLVDLDEAYVDLYLSGADLRLGQQVVSWGTAYGLNPTSYVNPVPSAALSASGSGIPGIGGVGGLELAGLPVPAVSATIYPSWGDAGLVAVVNPRLQGVPLPADTQAAILQGVASQVAKPLERFGGKAVPSSDRFSVEPPESLSDRLEYAARVGTRMGNWDLYVSAFRGWDDYPVLWVSTTLVSPTELRVDPKAAYRKVTEAGAAVSCTWGPYTLWGEGSYAWPEYVPELDDPNNIAFSSNEPHWRAVMGGDRTFGDSNDVYLMAEYIYNSNGSILVPYEFVPGGAQARHYAVGAVRWQPGADHQFEVSGIYCANDGSYVAMPRYTYQVDECTSLWLGLALPGGGEETEFGSFNDARSAMVGLKLAF
ncbi:MAG: hypothetical protein ACM3ZO_07735 [Clostridia bacterium]